MCKKKAAGIALVVTAIVLLTLGIVLGLLLPNLAHKAIEGVTCVDSKESTGYKTWVGPTYTTTRVYIWNITNKQGFLYRQEKPQLVEKGPYVYSTTAEKIDVKFENVQRTSRSFDQSKYNKTLTEKECPTCNENDQFTVLNAAYLGLMTQAQSAESFSSAFIPFATTHILAAGGDRNATLLQFGSLQPVPRFAAVSIPTFGAWVNSNPATFSVLLAQRNETNFTLAEMRGLYDALTDGDKFGQLMNPALVARCTNTTRLPTKDCGLLINLKTYFNSNLMAPVKGNIDDLLCSSNLTSCFKAPSNVPAIIDLYRLAVLQFVVGPLRHFVLGFLDSNNYGLTTTRGQRDLALGYVMTQLPFPPLYPNGVPVPGPVTSHSDKTQAEKSKNSSFYTCESTQEKRFTWAAYNGKTKVDQLFYPNATSEQLNIRGYYAQFPGAKKLKACSSTYTPSATSYEIFVSTFYLSVPVTYGKDVELHSIPLHRYFLEKSAMKVNNVTVFTRGLLDTSKALGGPVYASLPRFLYGDPVLSQGLNLSKPTKKLHGSFVDIEPISGSAMQLKLRIQLNGMILDTSVDKTYPGHANVNYLKKPIPILWSEIEASIDPGSAEEYSSKLFGSLRLSCGLMVALPVIGGILLLIGGVLIVLAIKKTDTIAVA